MLRRSVLLSALLLVAVLVPATQGVAGASSDYEQVVDLTFPFTEDTSVTWPDSYDASRGGGTRTHQATDMMVAEGTPIHAVVGGTVARARLDSWGWNLTIDGTDGRSYVYLHLGRDDGPRSKALAAGVEEGATVERGQLVAYAGCSGNAYCGDGGHHLHLEIHDDRVTDPYGDPQINPYPSLEAAVERGDYPDSMTTASPEPDTSDWTFADVPPGSTHHDDIVSLYDAGLTSGCTERNYCPQREITRAEMARFLNTAGELEPGEATFDDVPATSPFVDDIAAIADAGITDGCNAGPNMFCPDQVVTRAQMAKFLAIAAELPPGDATFDDVPPTSEFADDIAAIAEAKITIGCTTDTYCPNKPVLRSQIATFMVRTYLDR